MSHLKHLFLLVFFLSCGTVQAQRGFDLGNILNAGKDLAAATTGVSEEDEIKIGRDLAGRLLGQIPLVDDADVQAYVNRVGRWIALQSERPDIPSRFGVANAANINAMAMPGGTILITRGRCCGGIEVRLVSCAWIVCPEARLLAFKKSGKPTVNYPCNIPQIGHAQREIAVTMP